MPELQQQPPTQPDRNTILRSPDYPDADPGTCTHGNPAAWIEVTVIGDTERGWIPGCEDWVGPTERPYRRDWG